MTFILILPANMLPASVKTKLIMSEKPNGTVALHYGDLDAHVFYEVEDYLPTLPNTVSFCSLHSCSFLLVYYPNN